MPGFDGTGPMGMGPMTGGGRGFCAIPLSSGWPAYAGMRFSRPYAPSYHGAYGFRPSAPRITREQELEVLKAQSQALAQQLTDIQRRIDELEKKRG